MTYTAAIEREPLREQLHERIGENNVNECENWLKKNGIKLEQVIAKVLEDVDYVNSQKSKHRKYMRKYRRNPLHKPLRKQQRAGQREEKRREEKKKNTYKEFVLLFPVEYEKLKVKLGEQKLEYYLNQLNNYIGSKGKKYRSHYHTILTWADKEMSSRPSMEEQYKAIK